MGMWPRVPALRGALLVLLLATGARPALARASRPLDTDPARWRAWDGRVVKAITAKGLKRTRVWRLRHVLETKIGARFDADRFANDVRRVRNLELFSKLRVKVVEVKGGVAIRFRMKDKWSLLPYFNMFFNLGSVSVITGVYDANTLGTLSYVDLKLLLFSWLPLTKDSIKPGGALTVSIPYLFGQQLTWWFDIRATTSIMSIVGDRGAWAGSWLTDRYGGYHSLSWSPFPWLSTAFTHSLFWDRFRDLDNLSDTPTVPRPQGGFTHSFRWSFTLGHLSYRRYLMHGMRLWFGVGGASRAAGSRSSYVSAQGDFKAFYNLGERAGNIGLWMQGGYMKGGRYSDLFRLGSWTGLRGFYTGQFAARAYLLTTVEYRTGLARLGFPIVSVIPYFRGRTLGIQAAVFADGGMLAGAGPYRTRESGKPLVTVGAGLRIMALPLYKAVLRLDFAYVASPYRSYDFIIATQQYF